MRYKNIEGEPYGTETHEMLPRRDVHIIYLLSMLSKSMYWFSRYRTHPSFYSRCVFVPEIVAALNTAAIGAGV